VNEMKRDAEHLELIEQIEQRYLQLFWFCNSCEYKKGNVLVERCWQMTLYYCSVYCIFVPVVL